MKKIILRCFAVLIVLALLPTTAAFADDLEVHISSDPDDVIQYIPLKQEDSSNLSINGVNFVPDITPGNCVKLEGGDALMATLINDDPEFFNDLNAALDADPPITKDDVFIRHGNVYLNVSDDSTPNLYDTTESQKKFIKRALKERPGNPDYNFSNYQAMKLLEGQKYSINADDQNLINLGIGNVWQAPVPDKDYDPLSQYVPPEVPPNTGEPDEPDEPQGQPDVQGGNGGGGNKVFDVNWQFADSSTGSQTIDVSALASQAGPSSAVPSVKPQGEAPLKEVTVTVYLQQAATTMKGLLVQVVQSEESKVLADGIPDEAKKVWTLVWQTAPDVLELGDGFDKIEIYVNPRVNNDGMPTGNPTYTITNTDPAAQVGLQMSLGAPMNLALTDAPADDALTDAPADDALTDAPADDALTDAPADDALTDAPADDVQQDAPADDLQQDAPADDAQQDAPADDAA